MLTENTRNLPFKFNERYEKRDDEDGLIKRNKHENCPNFKTGGR